MAKRRKFTPEFKTHAVLEELTGGADGAAPLQHLLDVRQNDLL